MPIIQTYVGCQSFLSIIYCSDGNLVFLQQIGVHQQFSVNLQDTSYQMIYVTKNLCGRMPVFFMTILSVKMYYKKRAIGALELSGYLYTMQGRASLLYSKYRQRSVTNFNRSWVSFFAEKYKTTTLENKEVSKSLNAICASALISMYIPLHILLLKFVYHSGYLTTCSLLLAFLVSVVEFENKSRKWIGQWKHL